MIILNVESADGVKICNSNQCFGVDTKTLRNGIRIPGLEQKVQEVEDTGFRLYPNIPGIEHGVIDGFVYVHTGESITGAINKKLSEFPNIPIKSIEINIIDSLEQIKELYDYQIRYNLTFERIQINEFYMSGQKSKYLIDTKELVCKVCTFVYDVMSCFNIGGLKKLYFNIIKRELYSSRLIRDTGMNTSLTNLEELVIMGDASKFLATYQTWKLRKLTCGFLLPFRKEWDEGFNNIERIEPQYQLMLKKLSEAKTVQDRLNIKSVFTNGAYYDYFFFMKEKFEVNILEYAIFDPFITRQTYYEGPMIDKLTLNDRWTTYPNLGDIFKEVEINFDIDHRFMLNDGPTKPGVTVYLPSYLQKEQEQVIKVKTELTGKVPKLIVVMLTSSRMKPSHPQTIKPNPVRFHEMRKMWKS